MTVSLIKIRLWLQRLPENLSSEQTEAILHFMSILPIREETLCQTVCQYLSETAREQFYQYLRTNFSRLSDEMLAAVCRYFHGTNPIAVRLRAAATDMFLEAERCPTNPALETLFRLRVHLRFSSAEFLAYLLDPVFRRLCAETVVDRPAFLRFVSSTQFFRAGASGEFAVIDQYLIQGSDACVRLSNSPASAHTKTILDTILQTKQLQMLPAFFRACQQHQPAAVSGLFNTHAIQEILYAVAETNDKLLCRELMRCFKQSCFQFCIGRTFFDKPTASLFILEQFCLSATEELVRSFEMFIRESFLSYVLWLSTVKTVPIRSCQALQKIIVLLFGVLVDFETDVQLTQCLHDSLEAADTGCVLAIAALRRLEVPFADWDAYLQQPVCRASLAANFCADTQQLQRTLGRLKNQLPRRLDFRKF